MPALVRHLGAGLGLGLLTGAVARGFMALLTEAPEFSWSGTGFILGVFVLAGLALAATYDVKLRNRSRWWKLLALPAAIVGFGAGMLMVPGILGFTLVGARRRWLRAVGAFVLAGFLALVAVVTATSDDPVTARTVAGLAVMVGCCAALAAALRIALTGWTAPDSVRTQPSTAPVATSGGHRGLQAASGPGGGGVPA